MNIDRQLDWLARAMALFGLALLAVTWRLWTPQTVFPQAPLLSAALSAPAWLDWLAAAGMVASLTAVLVLGNSRWGRPAALTLVAATALACVLDQHRLQPWAYQFALFGLVLGLCRPAEARPLLRLLVIGVYIHSALGKFDHEFLTTTGQDFLSAVTGPFNIDLQTWSPRQRMIAATEFPIGELVIGVALCHRSVRWIGLVGAVLLHATLIAVLGPWGLSHRPGVLIWNGFFIVQVLLLFTGKAGQGEAEADTQPARWKSYASRCAAAVILATTLLPFTTRLGWYDHWPSWGLYSPSNARALLYISRAASAQLPEPLQVYLEDSDDPVWQRLSISRWSLDTLSAPIYPQDRFHLAVAEHLAATHDLDRNLRVLWQQPPDRRTGRRPTKPLLGRAQLQQAASTFRLNARPRPAPED